MADRPRRRRLCTGCKSIPEDQFRREREGRAQRDAPAPRCRRTSAEIEVHTLLKDIYPDGHPYHEEVGGDDKTVASITLDDACKFMSDYYVPERATMVIAGNVDETKAKLSIERLPAAALPPRRMRLLRPVPPLDPRQEDGRGEDEHRGHQSVAFKLPATYT